MISLDDAVSVYQVALEHLPTQRTQDSPSKVLSVLVARDHLAHVLSRSDSFNAEQLYLINELDQRLKSSATTIDAIIECSTLADWRESSQPPASAWWWHLDERAAEAEPKPHPLWAILAGFFITLSFSLTAEISRRFLSVGPDSIGVFSTISQALLTLLAGSALTQAGRQGLERFLSRLGIALKFQHQWKMGLALTVLLVVLVLRLSLPTIAHYYNDQGVRLQSNGQVTSAIESYQRAISLNPDYAEAHYNLATAFEDVLDYDKALGEYQTAIRADPQLYLAYNNLARLYMLRRNDFASALSLLNNALELKFNLAPLQENLVRYSLLKNRGWADFGLKYFGLAEVDLRQALTLRGDGAAAHCLLAQLLEVRNNPQAALAEWEACLRYEKGDFIEASWLGMARERLSQGGSK